MKNPLLIFNICFVFAMPFVLYGEKKLELMNALKNSFINENIENAFDKELRKFLNEIDLSVIPEKYTKFYERYSRIERVVQTNIKINNKILHQSKLINYFKGEVSSKKITKELKILILN